MARVLNYFQPVQSAQYQKIYCNYQICKAKTIIKNEVTTK